MNNNNQELENSASDVKKNSREASDLHIVKPDVRLTDDLISIQSDEKDNSIANLKNLVEQLKEKLNQVSVTNAKFLSIIAHDLRSPFCSILMSLEYLKSTMTLSDCTDNCDIIDDTASSVNSTLDLLDDLLKWTVLQNQGKSFNPVEFSLFDFLTEEIKNLKTIAVQKHITLTLHDESRVSVAADLRMVRTVVRNLISNALKFTRAGGEVIVSSRASGQFIEIDVQDSGIGLSSEVRKNLFNSDPYTSQPGTNNEKSTGLGLLLCKDFVEMHGGRICVSSEPGKGSIFGFTMRRYSEKFTGLSISYVNDVTYTNSFASFKDPVLPPL